MLKCPFCPGNGQVEILDRCGSAYIVAALDPEGTPMPGHYLVIPFVHTESVLELPLRWHRDLSSLVDSTPEYKAGVPFNISYNQGRPAGQRLDHAHAWIIFRQGEEGKTTENLGLAALLKQGRKREE